MKIREPFYTFGKCEECGSMLTEQEYMKLTAHTRRHREDLDYYDRRFPPLSCDKCYGDFMVKSVMKDGTCRAYVRCKMVKSMMVNPETIDTLIELAKNLM